jgi:hypothetical protein
MLSIHKYSCFKLKASHSKEYFMAKNAPAFCEIWFVWRGRHIWTREASAAIDNSISIYNQDDIMMIRKRTRFSPNSNDAESILEEGYTSTSADLHETVMLDNGQSNDYGALGADVNHFYNKNIPNLQDAESAFNSTLWPESPPEFRSKVDLLLHLIIGSFVIRVDLIVLNLKCMVFIRKCWIQILSKS